MNLPQAVSTLLVAMACSMAVWTLSPWITGQQEAWDADGLYYPVAMLVSGLLSGACSPRPLWAHLAGSVLGPLLYQAVVVGIGPLLVIGMLFLLAYGLGFAVAAAVAGWCRNRIMRQE